MSTDRFMCDRMLGRLARWLRMMGLDTEYPREMTDPELAVLARSQGRVLLTRDRGLAARSGTEAFYVESHDLKEQIEAFVSEFGMPGDWFRRCSNCNGVLSVDEPEASPGGVPEVILFRNAWIWTCRRCHQAYWQGTHHHDIESTLRDIADRLED